MGPLLKFTDDFFDILEEINDIVSDKLIKMESDPMVDNHLGIEEVDKSRSDWSIDVKINGKWSQMKLGAFVRSLLPGVFSDNHIYTFTSKYNRLRKGNKINTPLINQHYPVSSSNFKKVAPKQEKSLGKVSKIVPGKFKYNPLNIRSTFISLVTETYPYGHEEEVVPLIKSAGLSKDQFGNYYKIIGKSETMFTSHLDTASRDKSKITLYSELKDGQEYIMSDGTTILGADDKAGVTILLYLIKHNIPGIYYFFIGEERGGIGSNKVANVFDSVEHLNGVKRCVSFDRRNYYSIITNQMMTTCCSDVFATALAKELNKSGMKISLDTGGIYTDSASFIDEIPECTNISVGYFHEHTHDEYQNITFLEKLCKASVKVNWESLPTHRRVGLDERIALKYKSFLSDVKKTKFNMGIKIMSGISKSYINMELSDMKTELVKDDFINMNLLFKRHKIDLDISFEDEFIKIELV